MTVAPHPHFSGWRVCGASVLTQAVAIGFTLGSVGVFAAPLAREFGATATEFNLAVSLFSLMMNLSMPFIGRFLDRGSIRRVMAVGAVVLAVSLGLMSRATALWQIGLLFGVGCAVGMAMLGPMSSSTAMASWFDRLRGRALGIANAGAPAGPALIAPIAAFAITSIGWRATLIGFAAVTLVVALPTIALGMIDRPRDVGQFPDGEETPSDAAPHAASRSAGAVAPSIPAEPWDSGSILHCRDFWLLALAAAPFGATGIVMGANAIPFMMHGGATAESASVVVILQSLGAVTGPLVFGSLADRIHPRLLFIGLIATLCLGLGGLMLEPGYLPSLGLFTIVGVVGGSMMPVYGALIGRLFGPLAFGQVMGLGALLGLPVIFLAPLGFGFAFDASQSYTLGMAALTATLLIAAVLFGLLPNGAARRSG